MQLLKDGWNIVIEQRATVAVFVALATILGLLESAIGIGIDQSLGESASTLKNFVETITRIAGAAGYAAIYAIFFARLGKEIDKPLWKCADDEDALRRFFVPWFILTLTLTVIARIQAMVAEDFMVDASITLDLLIMALFLFVVPVGACIMYWGRLTLDEIPEALSPIIRQFPLVALVLFIGFMQFFIGVAMYQASIPEALRENPLVYVPSSIFLGVTDCWAFSVMWLVLMVHRDTDYGNDLDF